MQQASTHEVWMSVSDQGLQLDDFEMRLNMWDALVQGQGNTKDPALT
jgi:hypothetical protein